jgi:hypothetical protein
MRKRPSVIGISSNVEGISVRTYANAVEIKTKNGRQAIEQTKEDPDNCIITLKICYLKRKLIP